MSAATRNTSLNTWTSLCDTDEVSVAWVGDDGEGLFAAYIDFSEPRPWCFMDGPQAVSVEEAVGWARTHTNLVIVTAGDTRYSAGSEPVEGFPPWPDAEAAMPRAAESGPSVEWCVTAATGWRRGDREVVAQRLAESAERDTRVSGTTASPDEFGFAITFTVSARSEVEASAAASSVMRDAWTASGIDAVPGYDFDVSSLRVRLH